MQSPTTVYLIQIFGALAFAAIGGSILRWTANSTFRVRAVFGVIARILVVFGFCIIGNLFLIHNSGQLGPTQIWFRAPTFYLSAALLLAGSAWWFRRRWSVQSRWKFISLAGYPILVVTLVWGGNAFINHMDRSQIQSLESAIISAKGQVTPEIQFLDTGGEAHKLSDFKGKVVLVNFWATRCGPCVGEMPGLSELERKFQNRGFVLVYLSPEKPEILARFFQKRSLNGVKGRLVPELPVPAFYHSGEAFPISFLISRDGIVKDSWLGGLPTEWTEKKIEKEL